MAIDTMECNVVADPHWRSPLSPLMVEPSYPRCNCRTSVACRFQVPTSQSLAQNVSNLDSLHHLHESLAFLEQMAELPDLNDMVSIMRKCRKEKDIGCIKRVHLHMCDHGLEAQDVLGNYLVPMFVECGNMLLAQQAFQRLDDRTEFAWTSFIQGFFECEEFRLTLELFKNMQVNCVLPSTYTLVTLLKACTRLKNEEKGKELHAEIIKEGFEIDPFAGNSLVDMYAKCGLPLEARDVFDELPVRDVVSWTALIAGYTEQGLEEEALSCLEEMKLHGLFPSAVTLFCGLKACGSIGALEVGRDIHTDIVNAGLESNSSVGNTLVDMYAKCGSIADAQKVFEEIPSKDVVTWTALISGYGELELVEEALTCFEQMKSNGVFPDAVTFISCLKACSGAGALTKGQQIHMEIVGEGFERISLVGSALVDMYARFGLLAEAHDVLYDLPVRDTVSWNALIGGYAEQGRGEDALDCLQTMQQEGLSLNPVTFVCSLKGCGSVGNIDSGQKLHDQVIKYGLEINSFIGNSLIYMYASCCMFEEAQKVFDNLQVKDTISCNTLIAGFADHGFGEEAIACWRQMQSAGVPANAVTFACSLKACCSIEDVSSGQELHTLIVKKGLEGETIVGNTLVDMYAKCNSLAEACNVFEKLTFRDEASWNTIISGYAEHGLGEEALKCLEQMQLEGVCVNVITYVGSLKAVINLGVLDKGLEFHAEVVKDHLETNLIIGNTLVDMYAKHGMLAEAQDVFDMLPGRDIISWSALISGYVEHSLHENALSCLERMKCEKVCPTALLLARCLNACGGLKAIGKGQEINSQITFLGFENDTYIGNSLVDMYAKCGWLLEAQKVFSMLPDRDAVAWTALIAGYSENGFIQETLDCLEQMQQAGFTPDVICFLCSLKACVSVGAKDKGQELHSEIAKEGLEINIYIGNSLVDMYAKSGFLVEAQDVFDGLESQDVVSWTALITGYADCGFAETASRCLKEMQFQGVIPTEIPWNAVIMGISENEDNEEAFRLYAQMQEQGILPDSATYVSIFKACGKSAAFEAGKRLHSQICKFNALESNVVTMTTGLIDMYGKCGSMIDAQKVFDAKPCRDLVRWNALITGYARQEERDMVFSLLELMKEEGLQRNGVTYVNILSLCSHAGLVEKGQIFFEAMSQEYGITLTLKHHSCMVDLLGRAGRLDEAILMMDMMPSQPDFVAWSTVLGACQKWGNTELGVRAFDLVSSLDENESAAFTLMSNIYADAHLSKDKEIGRSEGLFTSKGVG